MSLAACLVLAAIPRVGWPALTEFKFSFDHSPLSVYPCIAAFLLTTNPIPATVYGGLVNVVAVVLCRVFMLLDISVATDMAAPVSAKVVGTYVCPEVTNVPVVDASGTSVAGEVSVRPLGNVPRPQ